jgi:hypothetical protein
MSDQIRATVDNRGRGEEVEIDKYPDSCPICHHGIEAKSQVWPMSL